jgi:ABC-type antimicrobial peptide transport system permease subunit
MLFGSTFLEGAMTVPLWAMRDVPAVAQLFNDDVKDYRVIAEFGSKDARDVFVKQSFDAMAFGRMDEQPKSFVNPATTIFDQLHEVVTFFRSIGLGIGGFFLAISGIMIMTTLGKIISDSQKEIAVFRAVGAHKRDVKKMYFGYAWLLSSIGFVFGTFIAVGLVILASVKWGDSIYYQFAGQAVRTDFTQPLFVFLGFTPIEWILVYLGVVLVGLMAAVLPVRRASKIDPIRVLREL